ncbi:MAG: hypothetical protein PHX24_02180 [Acidithiobacillus sp.]|nr:hypothetical protein [Acidithiobacillus sp.]
MNDYLGRLFKQWDAEHLTPAETEVRAYAAIEDWMAMPDEECLIYPKAQYQFEERLLRAGNNLEQYKNAPLRVIMCIDDWTHWTYGTSHNRESA